MTDVNAARKHRHRYHAVPVPFEFEGRQYLVTISDSGYGCPFPKCGKHLKQRDNMERHIHIDHDVSNDLKLFTHASTGEHRKGDLAIAVVLTRAVSGQQTTQDNGDPSVQVPAPAEPLPQGVDSAGQSDNSLSI